MLAACVLLTALLPQAPQSVKTQQPERLSVAQLREKAPDLFPPLAAATGSQLATPASRYQACMTLRSWLGGPFPEWLLVAQLYDEAAPRWPENWPYPTTPLARATMWMRIGKHCDNRQDAAAVREGFATDITCYGKALDHGADGHLVLLAAAANAERIPAARMLWLLDLRTQNPFVTCDIATMPRTYSLLRSMSRSDDEWIHRPALRMLDQAMRHGAADQELLDWVVPEAIDLLANKNNAFSFTDSTACLGGPYLTASTRDSLIVSIASQAGDSTPVAQLLAYCEPHLKNPTFDDIVSDFAWKLAIQAAPQFDAKTRQRLLQLTAKHPQPQSGPRVVQRYLRSALQGTPPPVVKMPQLQPDRVTIDVDRDAVARDLDRIDKLADFGPNEQDSLRLALHSPAREHRIRALQLCQAVDVWSAELEAGITAQTANRDVAIRGAAYRALATRDRSTWPCAWLVHEAAFDPAPSIRQFYRELVR